jgi:hypothetical protein
MGGATAKDGVLSVLLPPLATLIFEFEE